MSEKKDKKIAPEEQAMVKHENNITTVDPELLLLKAIEKGLPVETMEKLLVMRRELRAEAAKDDYFIALSKFQKMCPVIIKGRDVYDKDGKLRYRFAPLDVIIDQVKDALEICGFSYIIKTQQTETTVKAICEAHHISGHSESTDFTVPIDPKAYMNAAQKVASALTYSKRYAFCDAFGILTGDEDIDGNGNDKGNGKGTTTETTKPPLVTEEKKKVDEPPKATGRFRQHIVADIVSVLTDKVFSKEERTAIKVEISLRKSNIALEALLATWQSEQNKRIEDFEDDIPMSAEEEKAIEEATASLFPEEEKAAQEVADRKKLEEPDIY